MRQLNVSFFIWNLWFLTLSADLRSFYSLEEFQIFTEYVKTICGLLSNQTLYDISHYLFQETEETP